MIKRYSTPDTDALFSEEAKMSRWLEIELAVTDALAATGVVPKNVRCSVDNSAGICTGRNSAGMYS